MDDTLSDSYKEIGKLIIKNKDRLYHYCTRQLRLVLDNTHYIVINYEDDNTSSDIKYSPFWISLHIVKEEKPSTLKCKLGGYLPSSKSLEVASFHLNKLPLPQQHKIEVICNNIITNYFKSEEERRQYETISKVKDYLAEVKAIHKLVHKDVLD